MKTNCPFFILFLFSFLGNMAFAQTAEPPSFKKRRAHACQSLQKLSDGVLIVRLTSNSRKIKQLKLMEKGKGLSQKKRQRYAEQLKKIETQTNQENERVMKAFTAAYDFSETLFLFDTAAHYLKAGKQTGYFLNNNMEIDSSIDLSGRYYLLVKYGFPTDPGQKRTKGMVVMDKEYKDMVPPFPYKYFQPDFNEAMGMEAKEEEKMEHMKGLAKGLSDEFGRYLAKCQYKGWMKE